MSNQEPYIMSLNIGKNYLNDWDVHHAIREIIANAIDEQKKGKIEIIEKSESEFIIKDYGRGIKINNFIMMGSEKAGDYKAIGKFGVGLKDALGVFYDNGVEVTIKTDEYLFQFHMKKACDLSDVSTLHVYAYKNYEENFKGTEVTLKNCKKEDLENAKKEFLEYKDIKVIETTDYGDILKKVNSKAEIYINGMKISEDKNLTFSYNIKNISGKLKKSLNRERKNVSRDSYREDIKNIIENSESKEVLEIFEKQLRKTYEGNNHSEITWNSVLVRACNYIIEKYETDNVRFISNEDIIANKELYDIFTKSKNIEIVKISQQIKKKMDEYRKNICKDELFIEDSLIIEDELIGEEDLTSSQKQILLEAVDILNEIDLIKDDYISLKNIKISKIPIGNNMHKDDGIIIPLASLCDLEICAVKIINVLSSLGSNSSEFKDRIVGELINIISKRNKNLTPNTK